MKRKIPLNIFGMTNNFFPFSLKSSKVNFYENKISWEPKWNIFSGESFMTKRIKTSKMKVNDKKEKVFI